MDATTTFPATLKGSDTKPATRVIPHQGGARAGIAAIALLIAVLAGLILGLIDGAAGRTLGDPGPATGPEPGLVGLVAVSSQGHAWPA